MFTDIVAFSPAVAAYPRGVGSFVVLTPLITLAEIAAFRESLPENQRCCVLLAKPDAKALNRCAPVADFVAVQGGSIQNNRFALANRQIDFLIAPCTPEELLLDQASLTLAGEKNVSLIFSLAGFQNLSPPRQAKLLQNYVLLAQLCIKARVKFLVCSLAHSARELKSVQEILSFSRELGFSEQQQAAWHEGLV